MFRSLTLADNIQWKLDDRLLNIDIRRFISQETSIIRMFSSRIVLSSSRMSRDGGILEIEPDATNGNACTS